MEPRRPFDPQVLALGKRLVESLRVDSRDDPVSAWMAHYIAGLMFAVESAKSPQEREAAHDSCMEAILKLWAHRGTLPGHARPFGKAQAAVEFLARLDPNSGENMFFRMRQPRPLGGPKDVWLVKAQAVDDAARMLVRHCLEQAFMGDAAELGAWVELAHQIDPGSPDSDVALASALAGLMDDERIEIGGKARERLIASLDVMLNELKTLKDELSAD